MRSASESVDLSKTHCCPQVVGSIQSTEGLNGINDGGREDLPHVPQ